MEAFHFKRRRWNSQTHKENIKKNLCKSKFQSNQDKSNRINLSFCIFYIRETNFFFSTRTLTNDATERLSFCNSIWRYKSEHTFTSNCILHWNKFFYKILGSIGKRNLRFVIEFNPECRLFFFPKLHFKEIGMHLIWIWDEFAFKLCP